MHLFLELIKSMKQSPRVAKTLRRLGSLSLLKPKSLPSPQKPATVPVLAEINSVHTLISCIFEIRFNIILLFTSGPKNLLLPLRFLG
jgi:hypothetical protein